MNPTNDTQNLSKAFKYYRDTVFEIDNDLRFWEPRLKSHVDELIEKEWIKNHPYLFQSLFSVSNTRHKPGLILHNKIYTITTETIQNDRRNFFVWVENLCCLRTYNALELLLMQAIYLRYFPTFTDPFNDKLATKSIKDEIRKGVKAA